MSMSVSASAPTQFRIATYNALNMFDDINDPDKDDDKMSPKSPESEAALAAVIRSSEADVIALQEVENIGALKKFRDSQGLQKDYPHVVLVEGNDRRGIDVALLSKHPIESVVSHKEARFPVDGEAEPGHFLRDLLQADITMPGDVPVRIFVTHLCSKIGGEKSDRLREAEALAAREIIKEQTANFPSQKYLIMGDFNDTPDSPAVKILTTPDESGWALEDTFADQPEAVSYPTREKSAAKWGYKKIDHILVSPQLAELATESRIHHHPKDELASDHWMVSTTFSLPKE